MRIPRLGITALFLCLSAYAELPPGDAEINNAYQARTQKDYDRAIEMFQLGLAKQPGNAAVHKDLAYTYLLAGENEAARDEFDAALKINPSDEIAGLEFAFLAYETKKPVEARRAFDRLRRAPNPVTRQTAEQAFQNIDKPLADGIARWKEALAQSGKPNDISTFSAHWELAQLAELRDELPLAAQQYEICRQLKPQLSEILLILARLWRATDRGEESQAALLAASRSKDSRTAEQALEIYGNRYPYPYEFLNALKIDPGNIALRKELGYLYLAMKDRAKAIEQFELIVQADPKDQSAREQLDALRGLKTRAENPAPAAPQPSSSDPKAMGLKSLAAGYSKDAVRFLLQAHEANPEDAEVMLKLGWAYNLAKDDDEAKVWFAMARHAEDHQIKAEATKAYHNLNGDLPAQTTAWMLPMYSTRWNDLFTYAQVKRSLPLPPMGPLNKWISLYASTRFVGDVKSSSVGKEVQFPQYFSESSFIFGLGVSTRAWHRVTSWFEAGTAMKYMERPDVGVAIPDYRGGVNYAKGFGALLGSNKPGFYYETTADAIYVSRFDKDWLFYSQNRAGRTIPIGENNSLQLLMNVNVVQDMKRQYWANTIEIGPGIRFRPSWLPRNVYFMTDFLRGVYLINADNPRGPNYNDIRVGFWYAITK